MSKGPAADGLPSHWFPLTMFNHTYCCHMLRVQIKQLKGDRLDSPSPTARVEVDRTFPTSAPRILAWAQL
jgi:hypothetical protein